MMLDNKNWIAARCSGSDQKKLIVFLAQSDPVEDDNGESTARPPASTTIIETPPPTRPTARPRTTEIYNPTSQ